MELEFHLENIRRDGCASVIETNLHTHPRVRAIDVDIDNGIVRIDTDHPEIRDEIAQRLKKLGYPEKGSVEGLRSVRAKASSLVCCAIGMLNRGRDRNG